MVNGAFVALAGNDDNFDADTAGPNSDSYVDYVNISGSTQLIIRVSRWNGANSNEGVSNPTFLNLNGGDIFSRQQTTLIVAVISHAVSAMTA